MVEKIYLLINTKNMSYMILEFYKDLSRDLKNKCNGIIKSELINFKFIVTIQPHYAVSSMKPGI
ncbi:hypothetical protein AGMMS50255_6790 [Spirochaetia bacterium]|nr:hypothetical protein AGMMS50255_6790 [Spirochaetia bacterium]